MSTSEYGNEAAERASMEMEWKKFFVGSLERMRTTSYTNDQLDQKENIFNGAKGSIESK